MLGTLAVAIMVQTHKFIGTYNRKVDKLVALSNFAKSKFIEGGIDGERIVVNGNFGEDLGRLSVQSKERRGGLFVGRLSEEKGIMDLIRVWNRIDYPLNVIGDGPLELSARNEAGPNVKFLGRRSHAEIAEAMSKAAFLVVPSNWYEMFGLVVVEAFSCGLPVISSDAGSLTELVEHGVTGLLVGQRDTASLTSGIQWAIEHPKELKEMGQAGRDAFERKHTAIIHYNAIMSIYETLIESKRKDPPTKLVVF
jgi:glycosyltransferase involved in cell wall biosynthesis